MSDGTATVVHHETCDCRQCPECFECIDADWNLTAMAEVGTGGGQFLPPVGTGGRTR
jgi:hypothetical protein